MNSVPLNTVGVTKHIYLRSIDMTKLDICVGVRYLLEYVNKVCDSVCITDKKKYVNRLYDLINLMDKDIFKYSDFLSEVDFLKNNGLTLYSYLPSIEHYIEDIRTGNLFESLSIKPCRVYGHKKKRSIIDDESDLKLNNIYFYFNNIYEKISPVHAIKITKIILFLMMCHIFKDISLSHNVRYSFFDLIKPIVTGCIINTDFALKGRVYSDYMLGMLQLTPNHVDNKLTIRKNTNHPCIEFHYNNDEADFLFPSYDDMPVKDVKMTNYLRYLNDRDNQKSIPITNSSSYITLRVYGESDTMKVHLTLKGINILRELPECFTIFDIPYSLEDENNIIQMTYYMFILMLEHTAQLRWNEFTYDVDEFESLATYDEIALIRHLQKKYNIDRGLCSRVIKAIELANLAESAVDAYIRKRYNSCSDSHQIQDLKMMIQDVKDFQASNPPINPVQELYKRLDSSR